ncbi:MAG TPA: hypothetical protein PKN04_07365 [bacterium]|mgnify:CR=1 FL=1|nr:hypothetical protein [bacterium]HNT65576.1 hypothetical protein [bacterium]HOX87366.1 hypothetical protein [bacterium]HPG46827.1 hypothetical protein [bacterium]HPM99193.1 hypothetical protein [bacterium]
MQDHFMPVQIRKIEIDKWCEGCAIKTDPGNDYVAEWVKNNAEWFRQAWNKSLCRHCQTWNICGHRVLTECNQYQTIQEKEN